MLLTWPRRPRIETTITARRRLWTARTPGGLFRVVHSISLYGLPDRWFALRFCDRYGCWDIISRHRKKARAFQAAEAAAAHIPNRNDG